MKVKYVYSKVNLDATVKFISTHNKWFIGKPDYVRQSIINGMQQLAEQFPNCYYSGTMGYLISGSVDSEESMDKDENIVTFSLSVDPSVTDDDKWEEFDTMEVVIDFNPEEVRIKDLSK